jgi:hypothetical protein
MAHEAGPIATGAGPVGGHRDPASSRLMKRIVSLADTEAAEEQAGTAPDARLHELLARYGVFLRRRIAKVCPRELGLAFEGHCQVNADGGTRGGAQPEVASGCGHGVPHAKRTGTQQPLLDGSQLMSSHAEQVPYDIVDGKKALGLCSRFETAHATLASPCVLVGDFSTVVGVAGVMHNRRHDDPVCGAVASKSIGDEAPWDAGASLEQTPKEPTGSVAVPAGLLQDVDDIAVLVHGAPEVLTAAANRHEEFV